VKWEQVIDPFKCQTEPIWEGVMVNKAVRGAVPLPDDLTLNHRIYTAIKTLNAKAVY
jgi:hypothetical protein